MSEETPIPDREVTGNFARPISPPPRGETPENELEHWGKRISRNLAALTAARGVSAVLKLFLVAYLTRALEPGAYGILGFGTALLSYFLLITRLGFDWVGTRDVARNPRRISELASTITSVKLFLSIAAYCLYAALVLLLPKGGLFKSVLLVQGLALFADAASLEWAYQGVERMGILAVRIVAISVLHVGTVFVLVHRPEDIVFAAAAQVGVLFILNAWLIFSFIRSFGPLRIRIDLRAWRALLPSALPIAASALMAGVFYNIDQVMLGLMRSEAEVGLYSASVRALIATLMPSLIIVQSFFPALSNALGNLEDMRERAHAFAAMMIPVGIPLATVGALLARPLLLFIAGEEFVPGAEAFALLMVNAGMIYLNMTFGHPLLAWNREKAYMIVIGVGAVLDIAFNFLLVPRYGIIGAASTTLGAQILLFVGLAAVHIRIVRQAYIGIFVRTACATLLGVVLPILVLAQVHVPLLVTLLVAGLSYGVSARLFKLVRPTFLNSLLGRS